MIFGSENFVETLLKTKNHSVPEMGCLDHIRSLGSTDPLVEIEVCSMFMRIIRMPKKNQAFSKAFIPLTFLREGDISLFGDRVKSFSSELMERHDRRQEDALL